MSDSETRSNVIDKIIEYVSPISALKRHAARDALNFTASYHQGASKSRLNYNWSVSQESIDTTIYEDRDSLVNRSRDLNRNDPIASGITDTFCHNVINTGLMPQASTIYLAPIIGEDKAKRFQEQAEKAYKKWTDWASATNDMTFEEVQFLAARQIAETGEFLALRRALKTEKGRPYMLALDIIESDRLVDDGIKIKDAQKRFGITKNERGERIKYNIRKTHPGDQYYHRKGKIESTEINAKDKNGRPLVFFFFPVLRPGQSRGIPLLAPVIDRFKTLSDYVEATLVAARVAACFAVFISSENPYGEAVGMSSETGTDQEGNSQRLETLEPGIIERIGVNKKVEFAKPEQPTTTFSEFTERLLRMIGSSLNIPYELVLNDFSKTNYSSAKASLEQAYRVFRSWQQLLIRHLCQPVWELLIEEAWLRGDVTAPNFNKYRWEYTRAIWTPPGWASLDPLKEANANKINCDEGFDTKSGVCAARGKDWEEVAEQKAREKNYYEKKGLTYEKTAVMANDPE